MAQLTGVVSLEALGKAVQARFPPETKKLNKNELAAGVEAAKGVDLKVLTPCSDMEEEEK